MRPRVHIVVALGAVLAAGCGGKQSTGGETGGPVSDEDRSRQAFVAMGAVLTHQRCLNCHPDGESPTQGDGMTAHEPPVVRGDAGRGAVGMRCDTCHRETNTPLLEEAGSVPGAPEWHLAPATMAWQGKSLAQICEQIKDPSRNGGRQMEALYDHMAHDRLVGWAWEPGDGRATAPGSQAEFAQNVRTWIDTGAHCPVP